MTEEEGTVSGDLDVTVDAGGKGLVRYRGTDTWLTIGNLDLDPPRTWSTTSELAAAIEAEKGARDAAGNVVPFEAYPPDESETPTPPVSSEGGQAAVPGEETASTTEEAPGPEESVAAEPGADPGESPQSSTASGSSEAVEHTGAEPASSNSAPGEGAPASTGATHPPAEGPSGAMESASGTGTSGAGAAPASTAAPQASSDAS